MQRLLTIPTVWLLIFSLVTFADFTIGVMSDTQTMAEWDNGEEKITGMTMYFVDHKEELNVVFVASLGDMTQDGRTGSVQWDRVTAAYAKLTEADIPFAPCQGNHDPSNALNEAFPVSDFEGTPTWGGSMNGEIENAYYLFSQEGMDFVLVVVEDGAGGDVLNWAGGIFEQYSDRRGIVVTHHFYDNIKNDLVTQHDNIFLGVQGHDTGGDDGERHLTTTSPSGYTQHLITSDYQSRNGGGDIVRYYVFKTDADEIDAFTYDLTRDAFETDESSEFSFEYQMEPVVSVSSFLPAELNRMISRKTQNGAIISGTLSDGPVLLVDTRGKLILKNTGAARNLANTRDLSAGRYFFIPAE